jgi:hypothetical protein
MDGLQNWFGQYGEEKILALTETQTMTPKSSNPQQVCISTVLFLLAPSVGIEVKIHVHGFKNYSHDTAFIL